MSAVAIVNIPITADVPFLNEAQITASIETVHPHQAREWLDAGAANRPITVRRVKLYADAMSSGRWRVNGEALIFNRSGKLMNGQHRLVACVQSGYSFRTMIVRGVPDEAFSTIDAGRPRSIGDIVALVGEKNANVLASALIWKHHYDRGTTTQRNQSASADEALKVLREHPGMAEWASPRAELKSWVPGSLQTWLKYEFSSRDPEANLKFWNDLWTGAGLSEGDPVLTLRNAFIREEKKTRGFRMVVRAAMLVKAWNARREGRRMLLIKWASGGEVSEKFPAIL